MKKPVDFDWYCKAKKDVINNAAYELIVALTAKSAPPRKFELSIPQRDDEMIANVVEGAINAVEAQIGYYCHPFYQEADKLPCYLGDLCDTCAIPMHLLIAMEIGPAPVIWAGLGSPATIRTSEPGTMRSRSS